MSESVQSFRTALRGFRREDVVQFLETVMTRHAAEMGQLRDDIKRLEGQLSDANQEKELLQAQSAAAVLAKNEYLAQCEAAQKEADALQTQCEALREQVTSLERELTEARQTGEIEAQPQPNWSEQELTAYRRAEAVERQARLHSERRCAQVEGLIADLSAQLQEDQQAMDDAAQKLQEGLLAFRSAIEQGQSTLDTNGALLRTLRPIPEEAPAV